MAKLAITIPLLLLSVQVHAGWFGPDSYEECIQQNMKGVTSDVAARAIMHSCRQQFPVKVDPVDEFDLEMRRIEREAESERRAKEIRRRLFGGQ